MGGLEGGALRRSVEGGNNAMETSPRPIADAAATRENSVSTTLIRRPMIYRRAAKELMEAK